jgi:hypothetical protein
LPSGAQHAVEHATHRQQILKRAQRLLATCRATSRRRRRHRLTLQIGPRRRNQQPAAIRQHQNQLQPPTTAHPPDQLKRATLQRMARPHDPDRRREAIEVGSVSCLLSIEFSTTR